MKNYLALYIGSAAGDEKDASPITPDARAEGMQAWGAWMGRNAPHIVDGGAPLGPTKKASRQGIAEARNNVTAYVIVQAESHDAAARLFEGHPHFTIFPGDCVEIMECLPIPGS